MIKNKQNVNIVLYNDKRLKLLDVTELSIQLGFNPLYFHFNNQLYEVDEQVIYEYCDKNNLDGYINLNKPSKYSDYNNECFLYQNNNELYTLCPTVYLLNNQKYGVNLLKMISVITLTKNKNYLDLNELHKLRNVLFCTMSHLIEIIDDVKTKAIISYHILSFHDEKNNEYNFTIIYNAKNYLDALVINYTNINDTCEFEC